MTFQEWLDNYEHHSYGEYQTDDLRAAFQAGFMSRQSFMDLLQQKIESLEEENSFLTKTEWRDE